MAIAKVLGFSLFAMIISTPSFAQTNALIKRSKFVQKEVTVTKVNYPTLAGTTWEPKNTLGQYVQFATNGAVTGFGGCNNFAAVFYQDNERMQILDLGAKIALCKIGADTEKEFLGNLQNARTLELSGQDLRVYNPSGKQVLSLTQRVTSKKRF